MDGDAAVHVLHRLANGPATLADLRAALPAADLDRKALPSMGEPDPFGELISALVNAGRVVDEDGRYRLAP